MATEATRSLAHKLRAGEHFGSVSNKCHITTAVFSEAVYPQKVILPEHSHELAFFTLILNGSYAEKFATKDLNYSPGTVLWRHANILHKDRIECGQSLFFFVEIKNSFLESLRQYDRFPERLAEQNGSLALLGRRLRREIQSGENYSSLIAEGLTFEMLGHLVRKNTQRDKQAPKWLADVLDRLNEEFTETLTTEMLAAEVNIHPVHLAAVFRRFCGETIGEYVQRRRVEYASELLRGKDLSLSYIAQCAGFSDQSHFTRIFKRHKGTPPGAYRFSLD